MVDICLSLLLNHIVIAHHSGAHEFIPCLWGTRYSIFSSGADPGGGGGGAPSARPP